MTAAKARREPKARVSQNKTFCEFFAGIGLVRLGLAETGWSCIYANDINPKKQELYEKQFGVEGHFHLGDVWNSEEVLARLTEAPFLATASFPCIDLSLAGHFRGFEGDHSSTLFGFTRVLEAMDDRRPKLVMLENVTGFITSQEGRDFESATRALAELGYWIDAFVLDARNFVPQSRPRVFVIGMHETMESQLAARKTAEDWFSGGWSRNIEKAGAKLRPAKLLELMNKVELPTGWAALPISAPIAKNVDVADLIDLDDNQEWWDDASVKKHHDMMSDRHRAIVDEMLASKERFTGTIYRRKREGKTRAEVRFDGLAGCLRTPKGGSARQIIVAIDNGRLRIRWMSPREYARLQGASEFPLVENTIQNLYGFGDAVCVPVIEWIDQHVLTPLFESHISNKNGQQPLSRASTKNKAGRKKS